MAMHRLEGPNYKAQVGDHIKISLVFFLLLFVLVFFKFTTLQRAAFVHAQVRQSVRKNNMRNTVQSEIQSY